MQDEVKRLDTTLSSQRTHLQRYDDYYEGRQPLKYMAPALKKEVGDRIAQVVLNWPRIVADAYENRLDVEGFRYSSDSSADETLWDVWQANDMDEQSQQGHLDSLVLSRSYVIVGSSDGDAVPVVTVESPFQVWAERDPRTRKVSSAIKRWDDYDTNRLVRRRATLYLPDSTSSWVYDRGQWLRTGEIDQHNLGRVPVVPLVNRPRTLRPDGVSEFADVIPVADAANKMATDMMISGEYHAIPRRWVFGLKESDFQDANGNRISPWEMITGNVWASENEDASAGQFPEADLQNFHNTIRLLAQITAQLAALPPHYMSFTGDNPTSADAIRSSETQLVKRVERKHTFLGGAWEDVQRLVLRFMTGEWDPNGQKLETEWRNPATPTVAQKADAILKLTQARVIPVEQSRIELGYTSEQRRRMKKMDADAAMTDPILQATRELRDVSDAADRGN